MSSDINITREKLAGLTDFILPVPHEARRTSNNDFLDCWFSSSWRLFEKCPQECNALHGFP